MKPGDFVVARQRLEAKPQATGEKLTTLSDAIRRVKDRDHIAVGGCLFSRTPLALLMEILRQGRRGLTLSRNLMCYEGEWFMAAGAVEAVLTSWFGIGLPWGVSRILREKVERGEIRFEEWSHLGLGLRYRAAAMGVPFLPTLTMLGSDLMSVTQAKTMQCPYTGKTLCLVPALFPDVPLLHVPRADRFGNCQIDGSSHMDPDIGKQKKHVERRSVFSNRHTEARPRKCIRHSRVAGDTPGPMASPCPGPACPPSFSLFEVRGSSLRAPRVGMPGLLRQTSRTKSGHEARRQETYTHACCLHGTCLHS